MQIKSRATKAKVLMFIVPALIIYLLFMIFPIIGAIYFSVMDWDGVMGSGLTYVGLQNFIEVLTSSEFYQSLKNLFKLTFFSVLFHTPLALILAVLLNEKFRGYRLFKAIYFIPTIFPLTAIGLLWYFIFMPGGLLNSFLGKIGLENLATGWLVDSSTAMGTIIFVNIWSGLGFFMVILLAGLTTIPQEIYEAAEIDGAGPVRQFFQITIPMLKPILSMCILLDLIRSVKVFDLIFVMTEGGPNGLTNVPTTLLYFEAFRYGNFGVGSAIGVIVLLIALILAVSSELLFNRQDKLS